MKISLAEIVGDLAETTHKSEYDVVKSTVKFCGGVPNVTWPV